MTKTVGPDSRVVPSEQVRCRRFDEDLVMVDLEGGQYFALDAIGSRMWELLASGKTVREVAGLLTGEYEASEAQILGDCIRLVGELIQRRLVALGP